MADEMNGEREAIIRAAVAAMPHTNPLVADDLLGGFTMHTEADDIVAIFMAGRASLAAAQSPFEECYVCGRPMDGLSEDDCHCFHRKELRASLAASAVETKRYADGTTATGIAPLPKHSPSVQHALRVLTDVESMLGGANGPTIQIRAVLESLAANAGSEPLTDSYVQMVPDKCDRIVWRNHYYHLPLDSSAHPSPPEGMAGWRPIETAPKDGKFLVRDGVWHGEVAAKTKLSDVALVQRDDGGAFEISDTDYYSAYIVNPTGWLPAPPIPASEAKGAT